MKKARITNKHLYREIYDDYEIQPQPESQKWNQTKETKDKTNLMRDTIIPENFLEDTSAGVEERISIRRKSPQQTCPMLDLNREGKWDDYLYIQDEYLEQLDEPETEDVMDTTGLNMVHLNTENPNIFQPSSYHAWNKVHT